MRSSFLFIVRLHHVKAFAGFHMRSSFLFIVRLHHVKAFAGFHMRSLYQDRNSERRADH